MKTKQEKKKPSVIQHKNILASPYDKFWPLVSPQDDVALVELLEKLLPFAFIPKGFIPSKKLRLIFKERDKLKRCKLWKQKNASVDCSQVEIAKEKRKHLFLGVNSLTRAMEKSLVAGCLISGDASPRLIVNHVVTMAACFKIPVLVVRSLKDTTRSTLGVTCLAFGLHNSVKEKGNIFHQLLEMITKLSKRLVVPDHFTGYEISPGMNEFSERKQNEISNSSCLVEPIHKDITSEVISHSDSFTYLYRIDTNKRVYVPPKIGSKSSASSSDLMFIPIEEKSEQCSQLSRAISNDKEEDEFDNFFCDDDDDDDDNNSGNDLDDCTGDNLDGILPDTDSFFCIDTKGNSLNYKKNSMQSNFNELPLKPTVVKKVIGNPNKKKRKLLN